MHDKLSLPQEVIGAVEDWPQIAQSVFILGVEKLLVTYMAIVNRLLHLVSVVCLGALVGRWKGRR
jgi:hypothetical protein